MASGILSISFDSSSYFLTSNLPVEIRDASNHLVAQSAGRYSGALPEGLYLVRATLPGGQRHEEVVQVRAGEPVERVLDGQTNLTEEASLEWSALDANLAGSDLWPTSPGDSASAPVVLQDKVGCTVKQDDLTLWTFEPADPLVTTPFATFTIGAAPVSTSLPINPMGTFPENACVVAAIWDGDRNRLITSFARQRRVAWTLEGVIRNGTAGSTSDLLHRATDLLLDKYKDPPAAALGALTLHNLGRLDDQPSWIENLARDFPWLPDGSVVLAALLCRRESADERARGLDVLIRASLSRMMFTDGLALLLDLLRRWPDGEGAERRERALAALAPSIEGVDWDAICLTVDATDEKKVA